MKRADSKFFTVLAVILCLVVLTGSAFAHSGRTDSQGGHKDNKNVSGLGYYHYHHGYGPHLHPGGVCPYAVPVATPEPTPTPTPTPAPTPTPTPEESSSIDWEAVFEKAKRLDNESNRKSTNTGKVEARQNEAPEESSAPVSNTDDAGGEMNAGGALLLLAAGGTALALIYFVARRK